MVFIYESRILTSPRPEISQSVVEEDAQSFIFSLEEENRNNTESQTQIQSSSQIGENNSVVFVPHENDVINLLSNSLTEDTLADAKTPVDEINEKLHLSHVSAINSKDLLTNANSSVKKVNETITVSHIPVSDSEDLLTDVSTSVREVNGRNSFSHISVIDSDDDQQTRKTKKRKKSSQKPVVVLEKLPDELLITDSQINLENSQTLHEFLLHERELLSFNVDISIENLALHGETSTAKRSQRLSLRQSISKAIRQRRQSHVVTSVSVNGETNSIARKRKTYCAFCEQWVVDIKLHRKEHDVEIFRCEVCGKKYKMQAHLSQHFRRVHREMLVRK